MLERVCSGPYVSLDWGRVGTSGQETAEEFATVEEAGQVLQAIATAKRRRGYSNQ